MDQISINISQFAIMVFFYINQSIHLQRSHMLTQNYIHVNLKGILFDISSNYNSHFFPNLSCNARPKSLEFPTIRVSSYMWILTIFIQTHPTFLLTNNSNAFSVPFPNQPFHHFHQVHTFLFILLSYTFMISRTQCTVEKSRCPTQSTNLNM